MKAVLELMTDFREYDEFDGLVADVSDQIAEALDAAIKSRGHAVFAVSGGSTPLPVYERLSHYPLDWSKVTIVLVDDRWVEPGLKGSNEGAIRSDLLKGSAASARFIGLKTPHGRPDEAEEAVNERLAILERPFDVVVLGMGGDGHTASWFPHAEGLAAALAEDAPMAVALTAERSEITGPFTERMTLSRAALRGARFTILLLKGQDKRETWIRAVNPGPVEDMPVRALINDPSIEPIVFWAPADGEAAS
ncbi:6-phosphogluconolactonase [Hyphobacterium sp. HN65]|uniref:6-phosphogluconolactonase n=1 Tax=Hyphobacterium lacteum TaxID=3116575 RepID=A0ABU7LU10_9PROT|nr:6-phosphogluconolactonase [Hyphobacterium sp. HN65]MEE2526829.1 6-phosphogluconolactonase [Hyphobacterium sp. HN65]